jgi:hypothetical protein
MALEARAASLDSHPSENRIVSDSRREHNRLRMQASSAPLAC